MQGALSTCVQYFKYQSPLRGGLASRQYLLRGWDIMLKLTSPEILLRGLTAFDGMAK